MSFPFLMSVKTAGLDLFLNLFLSITESTDVIIYVPDYFQESSEDTIGSTPVTQHGESCTKQKSCEVHSDDSDVI